MNISLPLYSLVPIVFGFINFIIGSIFVYFYFIKTHRRLVFLGLWMIFLSLFCFFIGFAHFIDNYIFAIWWAKVYYAILCLTAICYLRFIQINTNNKKNLVFHIIYIALVSSILLMFTKYFIPFEKCSKDFIGRFIFKKGIYFPFFVSFFYLTFIISFYYLFKTRKRVRYIESIKIDNLLAGNFILPLIGLNDLAGIMNWYKTVPLISYGFIIFSIFLIAPFFKRYIVFFQDLNKNYKDTIKVFAKMLEIKDPLSYGNARRVGLYARYIGEQMKLNRDTLEKLELAALLYNIGEIGVPDKLLRHRKVSYKDVQLLQDKIQEGKKIISRMVILYNLKDLINFPQFNNMKRKYHLTTQIISIADYINKNILNSYFKNRFNFEQILIDLKKNPYISHNLVSTIMANSNKIENIILENLLIFKGL